MDIQARKIEFVQAFLKLQNEELLTRLEALLHSEENIGFSPMTIDELNDRIDQSMEDSKNNRITSTSDLIADIEKWG